MMVNECVLCGRPGFPTPYFPPPDYDGEVEIALCQYHKGNYMAHGIKALDRLWKEEKVPEWEMAVLIPCSRCGSPLYNTIKGAECRRCGHVVPLGEPEEGS